VVAQVLDVAQGRALGAGPRSSTSPGPWGSRCSAGSPLLALDDGAYLSPLSPRFRAAVGGWVR
jgi:hypothetical protein